MTFPLHPHLKFSGTNKMWKWLILLERYLLTRRKRWNFFDEMIKAASETKVGQITGGCEKRGPIASSDSEDDVKITGVEEKSSYVFNPLNTSATESNMWADIIRNAQRTAEPRKCRGKDVSKATQSKNCERWWKLFFQSNGRQHNRVGSGPIWKIRQLVCDYIKSFGTIHTRMRGETLLEPDKNENINHVCYWCWNNGSSPNMWRRHIRLPHIWKWIEVAQISLQTSKRNPLD